MEAQLGCLVGCNAYLTPAGTQGLAPHHDDVELWVVQTGGTKTWRLYAPLAGHALPSQSSPNLDPADIGPATMEVTLAAGDVLYLPRGTVHQAVAGQGRQGSAHLTISTYQLWAYANLASHVIGTGSAVQAGPGALPLAMRRSPQPGFTLRASLQHLLAAPHGTCPMPDVSAGLAQVRGRAELVGMAGGSVSACTSLGGRCQAARGVGVAPPPGPAVGGSWRHVPWHPSHTLAHHTLLLPLPPTPCCRRCARWRMQWRLSRSWWRRAAAACRRTFSWPACRPTRSSWGSQVRALALMAAGGM